MRVQFSTLLGMPVTDDQDGEQLGVISGILCDPDRGVLEGCFVTPMDFFSREQRFVGVQDILRVGTSVHVRDHERLSDPRDLVRIAPLLNESRTILGQPIVTDATQQRLGKCIDIAFDTNTFKVLSILPRRFFRRGRPIPRADIVEITPQAIIVREQIRAIPAETQIEEEPSFPVAEIVTPTAG